MERRGTGFFVKEEGLLVTNRHVIDGKVKALAKLSSGDFFPLRVCFRRTAVEI